MAILKWLKNRFHYEDDEHRKKVLKDILDSVTTEKEQIKAKALKDSTDSMIKGISAVMTESSSRIIAEINKIEERKSKTVGGEYSTVFAFYFRRKIAALSPFPNFMLLQVIAKSEFEAVEKTKNIMIKEGMVPSEWEAVMSSGLNVFIEGKRVDNVSIPDIIKAHEPPKNIVVPIDSYINNLLYSRDKFCRTSHEKGVITQIVNRIKEKHAIANPS